jgi:hypothetical protein
MSRDYFINNFFESFLTLRDDKIASIRRRFCQVAQKVVTKLLYQCKKLEEYGDIGTGSSSSSRLRELRLDVFGAMDKLKNDSDEEVCEQAYMSE